MCMKCQTLSSENNNNNNNNSNNNNNDKTFKLLSSDYCSLLPSMLSINNHNICRCVSLRLAHIPYVLVIPWFVRMYMYDVIVHERERVHYRTYMRITVV